MKPFDLERAKAGHPVCTNKGESVRILCFDREGTKPILSLAKDVERGREVIHSFYLDGNYYKDEKEYLRLCMAPVKREGWVNVYEDGYTSGKVSATKEEALKKAKGSPRYVDTVRIEWEE